MVGVSRCVEKSERYQQKMTEEKGADTSVKENTRTVYHPVDRGWAWVVLLAAMMSMFLIVGQYRSYGIFYVEFVVTFNSTDTETSSIQAAQSVAYSIGAILTLTVGLEFMTCRQCVMLGGTLLWLGYGLSSFVPNIQTLYLTYGLFNGLGIALSFSAVIVITGTYFEKRRGLANGFVQAAGSLGTLLLSPGVRHLLDEYTLRGALLIMSSLCFHLVATGAALRPISFYHRKRTKENKEDGEEQNDLIAIKIQLENETSPPRLFSEKYTSIHRNGECRPNISQSHLTLYKNGECDSPLFVRKRCVSEGQRDKPLKTYISDEKVFSLSLADIASIVQDDSQTLNEKKSLKTIMKRVRSMFQYKIMKNGAYLRILIAYVIGSFAVPNPIFYLPAYANERGISKQDAAILISVFGCMDVIGRIGVGVLSDTGIIKRQYLIALGMTLNGISHCLAYLYSDFWTFVIYVSFYGVTGGVLPALYATRLLEILDLDLLRSGLLVMYTAQGLAMGIVSPFIGQLRDVTETYLSCYLLFGSSSIFASFFLWVDLFLCCKTVKRPRENEETN